MRAEVDGTQPLSRSHTSISPPRNPAARSEAYTDTRPRPALDDDGENHQSQWAREEQQMMIQEQDRTIDTISGTLSTLAQQAGLMGQEIGEHNECVCVPLWLCALAILSGWLEIATRMLGDLEAGVERTDSKLSDAMRRMRKFIRQTEGTFILSCRTCITDKSWTETKSGWCIIILVVILMILLLAVILVWGQGRLEMDFYLCDLVGFLI